MDKQNIINKLNENHQMYSYWNRCLDASLKLYKSSILKLIIGLGKKRFLSNGKACAILGIKKSTFIVHRDEIVDMNLIAYIKGSSNPNDANEYILNPDRIADEIINGHKEIIKINKRMFNARKNNIILSKRLFTSSN